MRRSAYQRSRKRPHDTSDTIKRVGTCIACHSDGKALGKGEAPDGITHSKLIKAQMAK
ncbi:hypothetical protein [Ferrimonas sp. YFM]|uniref:hypothetical protein n=1 Tax=Ferrimonas sp. YFM TaxID=3028878 RepID=UPI00257454BB|nr:hypothetical protein [Ferrimonas sp. YFM]BDY05282.1 hypothetical protein F0521_23230 [Ferrimonas sp. YFM]